MIENYARSINSTPTKVVNSWIKQQLKSEEVKKVFEEDEELIRLKKELKKAEREAEKAQKVADLKAEIKAIETAKKQG